MNKQDLERIAKEERNAYYREYRRQNKEKIKQHQKKYWERKAAQKQELSKE